MRTVIVLSGLAETTMPWRTFLRPCSCSTGGVGSTGLRFARAFSRSCRRRRRRASAFFLRSAARSAWRSSGVRGFRGEASACFSAARLSVLETGAGAGAASASPVVSGCADSTTSVVFSTSFSGVSAISQPSLPAGARW